MAKNAQPRCGKCINGVYRNGTTTGPCFRCQGKGYRSPEDDRRNAAYDAFRNRLATQALEAGDPELATLLTGYAR